jgi:hypothetical protein
MHDDGCKTLKKMQTIDSSSCHVLDKSVTNLGVIFGIPGVEGHGLKVKPVVKVHGSNDVLESGNDTLNSGDVLLFKSKGNRRRWNLRRAVEGEELVVAFGMYMYDSTKENV